MRRYASTEDATISKLEAQLQWCRNAYRAQEMLLDLERQHSRILGERFDALRSQLPDYGSKVEKWIQAQKRGEKACL